MGKNRKVFQWHMYYKTVYWLTLSPNNLLKVHLSIKVQSKIFCDTSQQIQYTVHVRVLKSDTLQFKDIPMFLYIKFIPNNITITQSQCYQSAHFETRMFLLLKAQTWTLIPQDHKNNLFLAFLHFSITISYGKLVTYMNDGTSVRQIRQTEIPRV